MADMNPTIDAAASEESPRAPMTRRQRWVTVMFSGCAFLTTYVGLAGPMSALHRTIKDSPWQRCIEFVFYPVVLVVEAGIEPFASLIRAWCSLFQ